ncbi:MAG: hypothetical protein ACERKV_04165 [Clostridiaceae bacterium]
MKKNILKIVISIMCLCLFVYILSINSTKHDNKSIDLTGDDIYWNVSLNIQLQYNSVLIIKPATDNFKIPSEINIDIIDNNKCVYTDTLEYIPDSNKNLLGQYRVNLNSNDYFKKDNNDVSVIIRFNGESSSISLN